MVSCSPLSGTFVVEIGHSVAAPFAGLLLGQLGAEVIKVEHPDGGDHARSWGPPIRDDAAALFHTMNREKLGISVNLRYPADRERLRRLILDRADVVIQNLRPGSIDALGLGAARLTTAKPGLIYCNLSAFGDDGPLALKPGYDPLMQAYGGLMSVTGEPNRPPVRVGVSIIDMAAGMWSVIGILAALQERTRTGAGGIVGTSLFETALAWMSSHVAEFSSGGPESQRFGSGAPQIVPYEMFTTADGALLVAAGNNALFAKLCGVLDRMHWLQDERFSSNQARVNNRKELSRLLQEIFAARPLAEWRARLDAASIPNAPMQSIKDVMSDAQTLALQILQAVPGTPMRAVGLPIRFDGARPGLRLRAPMLGEHTNQVLTAGSQDTP